MRVLPVAILAAACALGSVRAGDSIYYRTDENGNIVLTNVPDREDLRTYPGFGGWRGRRSGARYRNLVRTVALQHGIDPDLVHAVISAESNFDPNAVSHKGAQGLMQLMPGTARRYGVVDPFDPAENVRAGVGYLRYLLDLFRGDTRLALAAYNAGETVVRAVNGVPPYPETRNYVSRILREFGTTRTPYVSVRPATPRR